MRCRKVGWTSKRVTPKVANRKITNKRPLQPLPFGRVLLIVDRDGVTRFDQVHPIILAQLTNHLDVVFFVQARARVVHHITSVFIHDSFFSHQFLL